MSKDASIIIIFTYSRGVKHVALLSHFLLAMGPQVCPGIYGRG